MLVSSGTLFLQLHAWDVDEHVNLLEPAFAPPGHGVLLWFETTDFDAAVQAARALEAEIVEEPHENPNSGRREIWLRDPNGYVDVVRGRQHPGSAQAPAFPARLPRPCEAPV